MYSAVGYSKGISSLKILGTYTFSNIVNDNNGNFIRVETSSLINPISLNYNMSSYKIKAGAKLKLPFFQIFADYSIQKFPVVTVGLGLKF